ncbi:MAG: hypothetical protein A3D31_18045 [Candidatus Fluviicola riflensis]|nr:MAG: hypothetical protein CHH17_02985 [Candidatus Fluviicola riflensis]OGS76884.1 MAG: hypothetical protein A3D31_18045 [Candidatus Fluviicola riflensis]OGS81814.1 MAG: hypothetical protein A2724_15445 [Fluviicola sp. RIFCSPHIGHO2_01_FULL_43_53]OGS88613.1 MAG: hypothetical protein A3E30_07555 [Fluviicola sp. RIFCSPHIGHO2_12_FULL_43_24]
MHIFSHIHPFNADLHTPVGIYLNLRNHYRKPVLLESNDYHSRVDSHSFIGLNPLVEISVSDTSITLQSITETLLIPFESTQSVTQQLVEIISSIGFESPEIQHNGFFSYFGFEFGHFEETGIERLAGESDLPLAHLTLYEYLIVLDHFHDSGHIITNSFSDERPSLDELELQLRKNAPESLPFSVTDEAVSNISDEIFLSMVDRAKHHILRGDVFQLVVSRPFSQPFFGDDFEVYRQLRRLNPSPYLFYADMESYRLMGSSPETQIQFKKGIASIHPIAGTVRKTGTEAHDLAAIYQLVHDEKENAEHTMLVDLARNDLSKYCGEVKVAAYKEVQQFSHVIHLVSKVIGRLNNHHPLQLFSGTFPAGTLSGTPKPKALELLQQLEGDNRNYYGGAIGFLGIDGSVNLAIVIRSMLSKNNILHFRAGAGIVLDSEPENELQEVTNKLAALRRAISAAHSPQFENA